MMVEVPNRIWAHIHEKARTGQGTHHFWSRDRPPDDGTFATEYVRADIHEAELARLRAERDALRMPDDLVERLRAELYEVRDLIIPWATHCDYRAEGPIQQAVRRIDAALKEEKE